MATSGIMAAIQEIENFILVGLVVEGGMKWD
jgi:hypothetical protein